MKIVMPTLGKSGLSEEISPHFGRAPTFTIYDTETEDIDIVENTSDHMGGVGKPPLLLREHGANVMLCSGLGPKAVHMFESFGIRVYVGASGTVQDTIDLWNEGILQEATDENACKMHRH
jgi:predicted Fe-Mo cluster-binding NifX family protein